MTKQEIIDELNAGRLYGHGNWWPTASGHFVAETPTTKIRMCLSEARREAEALRRKRSEIDFDAVMPLLEAIVDYGDGWGAEPETPVGLYIDGDSLLDLHGYPTKHGDVRAVVATWKARRS